MPAGPEHAADARAHGRDQRELGGDVGPTAEFPVEAQVQEHPGVLLADHGIREPVAPGGDVEVVRRVLVAAPGEVHVRPCRVDLATIGHQPHEELVAGGQDLVRVGLQHQAHLTSSARAGLRHHSPPGIDETAVEDRALRRGWLDRDRGHDHVARHIAEVAQLDVGHLRRLPPAHLHGAPVQRSPVGVTHHDVGNHIAGRRVLRELQRGWLAPGHALRLIRQVGLSPAQFARVPEGHLHARVTGCASHPDRDSIGVFGQSDSALAACRPVNGAGDEGVPVLPVAHLAGHIRELLVLDRPDAPNPGDIRREVEPGHAPLTQLADSDLVEDVRGHCLPGNVAEQVVLAVRDLQVILLAVVLQPAESGDDHQAGAGLHLRTDLLLQALVQLAGDHVDLVLAGFQAPHQAAACWRAQRFA